MSRIRFLEMSPLLALTESWSISFKRLVGCGRIRLFATEIWLGNVAHLEKPVAKEPFDQVVDARYLSEIHLARKFARKSCHLTGKYSENLRCIPSAKNNLPLALRGTK